MGEEDRASESARKAFDLRERVSEHERFYIEGHYYFATGDLEKEKETLELAIKAYPNDSTAFGNLALLYNLYYGQFEKAIPLANESARLEPAAPFGYFHAGLAYMALNRMEESRSLMQKALDAKADNLFIRQQLYELALLNGSADVMQQQVKWSEGKPSEYLLLNEATNVAAARGQMKKAGELMQRSVQVTDRLGFKGTTAATLGAMAVIQSEFGNSAKARELATSSTANVHDRANLELVALALAMMGDVSHAQAIGDDLGHRFPDDSVLHQVNIPCVRALIELQRKAPEPAVQALEAVKLYELGTSLAFLPTYIRGQAYLLARRRQNFKRSWIIAGSIPRVSSILSQSWGWAGLTQ